MKKFKLFNLLSLIFSWVSAAGLLIYSLVGIITKAECSIFTVISLGLIGLVGIAAGVFAILQIGASKGTDPLTKKITNLQNKIINIVFASVEFLVSVLAIVFGLIAFNEKGETNIVAMVTSPGVLLILGLSIYQTILFVWRKKENNNPKIQQVQTPTPVQETQPEQTEQKVAQ